jgi:hypothetical protein
MAQPAIKHDTAAPPTAAVTPLPPIKPLERGFDFRSILQGNRTCLYCQRLRCRLDVRNVRAGGACGVADQCHPDDVRRNFFE